MIYRHTFLVRAPLAQVAEFHSHSASMPAITPPPIFIRIQHAPAVLTDGDEMDFTMGLGSLTLRWLVRIEGVSAYGFSDRQVRGPFAEWVHRHKYIVVDEQTTEVLDEVTIRLRPEPLWWVIGMGMRLGLPVLFAYRAWKTRRNLQSTHYLVNTGIQ
jgi:ligand-binding SRPBCC domain-containing protein